MTDLPFFVELNEQNLTETLQRSVETPLVINFYAPSHKESADFAKVLQRVAEQYKGQFILGLVNCETEQMIAAQFRIQALPTTYLFKEAQAIDAFPGALDEASLLQRLSAILPKEEDLKFQKALDFLQVEDYNSALPLLKEAWELSDKKNSDVALLYAETYIAMKKTEPAADILAQIPIQDRDSRWHGLQAQIELLIKAADTPEIQQLQADYAKNPTPEIALKLAVQLHQANRNEEALDAFPGALDEASLLQRLSAILPKEEDLKFQKALDFLQVEDYDSALPLLKDAWELSDKKNSDVALLYAETYIAMKKTEPAADILAQIPIQDRDSRWHGLQAQIELLIKAADTPEIQQLQADYAKNPTPEIALKLAVQLHQANRNEEALDLLFSILRQDLSAENGEVKQQFLSILSAIGNADPITNKYRRLLYSLLY